jgi:hypothetical protein
MTSDYQQLRHQAGVMSSYDGYLRSNIVNKLSQDCAVNFKNNIFIHASKRIQRYLINRVTKNKNKMQTENIESSKKTKKKIWKTPKYLFDPEVKEKPDDAIIKILDEDFNFGILIPDDPLNYFQFLEGWKNFILIPLYSAGRKHVQYDKTSFFELLKKQKSVQQKLGKPENLFTLITVELKQIKIIVETKHQNLSNRLALIRARGCLLVASKVNQLNFQIKVKI